MCALASVMNVCMSSYSCVGVSVGVSLWTSHSIFTTTTASVSVTVAVAADLVLFVVVRKRKGPSRPSKREGREPVVPNAEKEQSAPG